MAPEGRGCGLCVLPPGLESVGNPAAVHVVSLDEGTAACPGGLEGACVLHLTTTAVVSDGAVEGGVGGVERAPAAAAAVERGEAAAAEGPGEEDGVVDGGLSSSASAATGGGPVADGENGSQGVLGRAAEELLAAAGVEEVGLVRLDLT